MTIRDAIGRSTRFFGTGARAIGSIRDYILYMADYRREERQRVAFLVQSVSELTHYVQHYHVELLNRLNVSHIIETDLLKGRFDNDQSHLRNVVPYRDGYCYRETLKRLKKSYPQRFDLWQALCQNGEAIYLSQPEANLSVSNHPVAAHFRAYCRTRLRGRILDIGCGPLATPLYLEDYPQYAVAGIDPFGKQEQHPFQFVNAVAEDIPWADESFETAIAATSLDHLIDPQRAFDEIRRVITKQGQLLAWVYFVPGAKPFPPESGPIAPIDDYHLYHFDLWWFDKLVSEKFSCMEKFNIDGGSFFYRLVPR
jgi:SAM-dependent methyltransferase